MGIAKEKMGKEFTGSAVDKISNRRIGVELAKELACRLVVADLSELESYGISTIMWIPVHLVPCTHQDLF